MLGEKKGKPIDKYVSSYVIFDLETTGISCAYDEVIEISAIKVIEGKVIEEFSRLVNPNRPIPWGATAVNGITDLMVQGEPAFDEVLPEFIDFIGELPLVGHNIKSFDLKFIYRDTDRFLGSVIDNDFVDTLTYARKCLPQLSHYKLTDLAAFYHLSTDGAHRALNDCRMNQKVFELLSKEEEKIANGEVIVKTCPRCGNTMKKRSGKFGEFWGCGGFPDCRYTENI